MIKVKQDWASGQHLLHTSPGGLDHFKEGRLMFEQAMVRRAVACATDDDVARRREAVNLLASAREATTESRSADMLLHEGIAAIPGNPLHQPGAENVTLAQHTEILECIEARDEDGAMKAMRDHRTRANRLYRVTAVQNANSQGGAQ